MAEIDETNLYNRRFEREIEQKVGIEANVK